MNIAGTAAVDRLLFALLVLGVGTEDIGDATKVLENIETGQEHGTLGIESIQFETQKTF